MEQFAILIRMPGAGTDGATVERRVGPYETSLAAQWAATLLMGDPLMPGAAGAVLDVVGYDPAVEHRSPDVPTTVDGLVDALRVPDDLSSEGFPGLFALLRARVGHEGAELLWDKAVKVSDRAAQSGTEAELAVIAEEERLRPLRERCADYAAERAAVYTPPVIEKAALLLGDMEVAGLPHGIEPRDWGYAVNLGEACVSVVGSSLFAQAGGLSIEAVERLLDGVAVAFTHRRVEARKTLSHSVALRDTLPGRRFPLAVFLSRRGGWEVGYISVEGPKARVYAPFTEDGAVAVADVVKQIMNGERDVPRALR